MKIHPPAHARRKMRGKLLLITTAIAAHFLMLPAAAAASICRWVDENGQAQFSDVVPDKYKGVVTCTHSQPAEPSAEQRAAAERARSRVSKPSPPLQAASKPPAPQVAALPPAARLPTETVTDSTDCKTWQRLFDESGACFAPYRTSNGGVKAEAFDKCNEVPSPQEKCGPPSN